MAQCGLAYTHDTFDKERFERIRTIAAEMMAEASGLPPEQVAGLFCNESGFQTPKLDTRAAIFRDGKILLVQEKNGKWSLPGGWVDVLETVKSNTEKEVLEEAGLSVVAERIIAVQDRNRHNPPAYAYNVCKVFVLCSIKGGAFQENIETIASDFFDLGHLPPLAVEKNTEAQVAMCFEALNDPGWVIPFD